MKNILTPRELKVLSLILDCKRSKKTITLPHVSLKVIECHRKRIYRKLGVDNVDDLYKVVTKIGWYDGLTVRRLDG